MVWTSHSEAVVVDETCLSAVTDAILHLVETMGRLVAGVMVHSVATDVTPHLVEMMGRSVEGAVVFSVAAMMGLLVAIEAVLSVIVMDATSRSVATIALPSEGVAEVPSAVATTARSTDMALPSVTTGPSGVTVVSVATAVADAVAAVVAGLVVVTITVADAFRSKLTASTNGFLEKMIGRSTLLKRIFQ